MAARILDGKAMAAALLVELGGRVGRLAAAGGPTPKLVAVLVGDNPASRTYVRAKERACAAAGVASEVRSLHATTPQSELMSLIDELNGDQSVHGRDVRGGRAILLTNCASGEGVEAVVDRLTHDVLFRA